MFSAAERQALDRIAGAPLRSDPFPHLQVEDVLPAAAYAALLANWPARDAMRPITELGHAHGQGYENRRLLMLEPEGMSTLPAEARAFWQDMARWLLAPAFRAAVLARFKPQILARFPGRPPVTVGQEAMLVEDETDYALGPHTDSPTKLVSVLFYVPPDDARPHLGTSLYQPREAGFTCAGGRHHGFDGFTRVTILPYVRNSLFAFAKTDRSFHGVEPVAGGERRRLILYDLRVGRPP